jgi:hypothetical protein
MWFNWFASLMWFDNISCGFLKIKILIPMTDFVLGGMLRWHKANVDRNTVIHTTWKKCLGGCQCDMFCNRIMAWCEHPIASSTWTLLRVGITV